MRVPIVIACVVALLAAGCAGGAAPTMPSLDVVPPPSAAATSSPTATAAAAAYLLATPVVAPPIELTDSSGAPFSLGELRGSGVLVSFGYTHCPDVCPATVGIVSEAITALGGSTKAVFVTIDPARDTAGVLADYVRYLASGYHAVTGTEAQIRAIADAWGVQYAREEPDASGAYGMSHSADVFLVDRVGLLRAAFPFGTQAATMTEVAQGILDGPEPSGPIATTVPGPSAPPEEQMLGVEVESTSVWAGGDSPMILTLSTTAGRLDDRRAAVTVQLETRDNAPVGAPVVARAVLPPGETTVFYVATVDIPTPGWWRFAVTATTGGVARAGSTDVAVGDPGATAALGQPAPNSHTPTLVDVGGVALAVTTDPVPDLRLYRTSTSDALAAHQPFVLVVDSTRFRTTAACGKALVMVKYLVDRWPETAFIHLEPFRYDVQQDTAILEGSLSDPTLVDAAAAWGIGVDPWAATSMPWIFVVDGNGTVRAKYEGVIGSDDVDVIVAMLAQGG